MVRPTPAEIATCGHRGREAGGDAARRRTRIMAWLRRFLRDEKGLETVEYAIIAALITIAAITALTTLGTNLAARFSDLATKVAP
jgi:pilus assembly protein Flp/PilA